jgi:VanZ family protein
LNQWLTLIATTYSVFVLYGSLVPLELRPLDWAEAWRRFSHIRYISISIAGRADWVANILLYIPLSFLWCARANAHAYPGMRIGTTGFVLISCVAFACLVEFLQVWFPQRTMSQNDLLAEALGSTIGVLIWLVAGRRVLRLAQAISQGGREGLDAVFVAYAGLYVAYSLFPFDFLVSGQELSSKLASDTIAPIMAASCGGLLGCSMKLTLEVASFVPFGMFLTQLTMRRGAGSTNLLFGILLGAFMGAAIEVTQIFIASGISQGISVGTRALGMMVGIIIARAWSVTWLTVWLPVARGAIAVGVLGYLLLLAVVASRGEWQTEGVLQRLSALHWLPFYYHYYTTEQIALISLMRNAILYAPVGMAVWVWRFAGIGGHRTDLPGATAALWLGAILAVLMESGRLLKASGHADPTNILIGAAAAWLTFRLTAWFAGCLLSDEADKGPVEPRQSFLR